jgi:hypothetical protein
MGGKICECDGEKMPKYVICKILMSVLPNGMSVLPNSPIVYILGELRKIELNDNPNFNYVGIVWLSKILWCDFPNWERYYPNYAPFNIKRGWSRGNILLRLLLLILEN